jgi:hypothetical protein
MYLSLYLPLTIFRRTSFVLFPLICIKYSIFEDYAMYGYIEGGIKRIETGNAIQYSLWKLLRLLIKFRNSIQ